MDLIALMQGFIAAKSEQLCIELAEKYEVPLEELADIVESFLKDTYGPAERLAEAISCKERPVFLFIGRSDCKICQKSKPYLEKFLLDHKDLDGVLLDYSHPEGLLYHVILQQEKGMLPLIVMTFRGSIRMIFAGECLKEAIYEKYYNDLRTECSQNIYAV